MELASVYSLHTIKVALNVLMTRSSDREFSVLMGFLVTLVDDIIDREGDRLIYDEFTSHYDSCKDGLKEQLSEMHPRKDDSVEELARLYLLAREAERKKKARKGGDQHD